MDKSTVDEIRERFDSDVERFSNLDTGQSATIDAPLVLDLIAEAAASITPSARTMLDIGCGAGNYTLKLLQRLPDCDVTLVDLSRPMLARAVERVSAVSRGKTVAVQGDIRELALGENKFDIVLAAAVLHHLRTDAEWRETFAKIFTALRPGGSLWVSDLVRHEADGLHDLFWRRYGEYLTALKGEAYRDTVLAYVDREDTPQTLLYQVDLLRETGFSRVEILHKNVCFAAYCAVKGA